MKRTYNVPVVRGTSVPHLFEYCTKTGNTQPAGYSSQGEPVDLVEVTQSIGQFRAYALNQINVECEGFPEKREHMEETFKSLEEDYFK